METRAALQNKAGNSLKLAHSDFPRGLEGKPSADFELKDGGMLYKEFGDAFKQAVLTFQESQKESLRFRELERRSIVCL